MFDTSTEVNFCPQSVNIRTYMRISPEPAEQYTVTAALIQ